MVSMTWLCWHYTNLIMEMFFFFCLVYIRLVMGIIWDLTIVVLLVLFKYQISFKSWWYASDYSAGVFSYYKLTKGAANRILKTTSYIDRSFAGAYSQSWQHKLWEKHSTAVVRRSKHQDNVFGGSEPAVTTSSMNTENKIPFGKLHHNTQSWVKKPENVDKTKRRQVAAPTQVQWCWPMKGMSPG